MALSPEAATELTADLKAISSAAPAEPVVSEQASVSETGADTSAVAQDAVSDALPAAQNQETAEAAPNPFLSQLTELGFQGVETEEQGRERLLASYIDTLTRQQAMEQQYAQVAPFISYGQQYLQQMHDPAYQQFLAQKQQRTPQPAENKDKPWFSAPEYNPALVERFREIGPDGVAKWKDGTPAEVRSQYEAHQASIQEWADKLVRDPVSALKSFEEHILERVNGSIEERLRQTQAEQSVYGRIETIKRENESWLYQRDPRTQEILVDRSGQPAFTPEGQRVIAHLQDAVNLGIQDTDARWNYAMNQVRSELILQQFMAGQQQATPPSQQVAAPADPVQATRGAILKRGAGPASSIPSRAGSEERVGTPSRRTQNPSMSPGKQLLRELAKS